MRNFKKPTDAELAQARAEAAEDIATSNELIDFFKNAITAVPGGMDQFDLYTRVASTARVIASEVDPEDLAIVLAVAIERLIVMEKAT